MNSGAGAETLNAPLPGKEQKKMDQYPLNYVDAKNLMNSRGICQYTARKALKIAQRRQSGIQIFLGSGQHCCISCVGSAFVLSFD